MEAVFSSLLQLVAALWQLTLALVFLVAPWTPLLAYVGFWLYAVDWLKLRPVIARGGWIAVLLIAVMTTLIWGLVAPPADSHYLLGRPVSNFAGKFVYVSALVTIMFLCGSVQLSGLCGNWATFKEDAPADDHHGGHGHDDGHGHGHDDSHGHAPAPTLIAHH